VDRDSSQNAVIRSGDALLLVPTFSLDEAVMIHGLIPPDLVKMDVEGSESAILEGARQTLLHHRPVVFVALHGEEQKLACQALLEAMGYCIYGLDGTPLCRILETDEVYALPDR
jgi:hypothetical protein